MSDYYATFTGRLIHPEAITEKDINLIDIAHHLTNINRYGGSLPFDLHYSVAEHSLLMACYAKSQLNVMESLYTKNTVRMALLHDASEAYLGDILSALKKILPEYKELEKHIQNLIYKKYGIAYTDTRDKKLVETLDKSILLDECFYLTPYRLDVFREKYSDYKALGIGHKDMGRESKEVIFDDYIDMCKEFNIYD